MSAWQRGKRTLNSQSTTQLITVNSYEIMMPPRSAIVAGGAAFLSFKDLLAKAIGASASQIGLQARGGLLSLAGDCVSSSARASAGGGVSTCVSQAGERKTIGEPLGFLPLTSPRRVT